MSKSLVVPPRVVINAEVNSLPVTIQPHAGMVLEAASFDAWFQAHFTPSSTTGTVNADTLAITNGTVSLIQNNTGGSGGDLPVKGNVVVFSARRKAGTSGALVDQEITFTINSVEVGRIEVDGSEEHFGSMVLWNPPAKGDPLFNLASHNAISWACTAADTDLEICIFIGGEI